MGLFPSDVVSEEWELAIIIIILSLIAAYTFIELVVYFEDDSAALPTRIARPKDILPCLLWDERLPNQNGALEAVLKISKNSVILGVEKCNEYADCLLASEFYDGRRNNMFQNTFELDLLDLIVKNGPLTYRLQRGILASIWIKLQFPSDGDILERVLAKSICDKPTRHGRYGLEKKPKLATIPRFIVVSGWGLAKMIGYKKFDQYKKCSELLRPGPLPLYRIASSSVTFQQPEGNDEQALEWAMLRIVGEMRRQLKDDLKAIMEALNVDFNYPLDQITDIEQALTLYSQLTKGGPNPALKYVKKDKYSLAFEMAE